MHDDRCDCDTLQDVCNAVAAADTYLLARRAQSLRAAFADPLLICVNHILLRCWPQILVGIVLQHAHELGA